MSRGARAQTSLTSAQIRAVVRDRSTLGGPSWAIGPNQDGLRTDDGARRWTDEQGLKHRVGAPAVVHADGRQEFWLHGRRVDAATAGA